MSSDDNAFLISCDWFSKLPINKQDVITLNRICKDIVSKTGAKVEYKKNGSIHISGKFSVDALKEIKTEEETRFNKKFPITNQAGISRRGSRKNILNDNLEEQNFDFEMDEYIWRYVEKLHPTEVQQNCKKFSPLPSDSSKLMISCFTSDHLDAIADICKSYIDSIINDNYQIPKEIPVKKFLTYSPVELARGEKCVLILPENEKNCRLIGPRRAVSNITRKLDEMCGRRSNSKNVVPVEMHSSHSQYNNSPSTSQSQMNSPNSLYNKLASTSQSPVHSSKSKDNSASISKSPIHILNSQYNNSASTSQSPIHRPSSQYSSSTSASQSHNPSHRESLPVCNDPPERNLVVRMVFKIFCGVEVIVGQGDLVRQSVTSIVNPANSKLEHGGGAARIIADAAGKELLEECKDYIRKNRYLKVSEVVATTAGRLSQIKRVIHVSGPHKGLKGMTKSVKEHLVDAFLNCMLFANDQENADSIAIPAISSGIYGVDKRVVAESAYEALMKFDQIMQERKTIYLTKIKFVNIDIETTDVFNDTFKRLRNSPHSKGKSNSLGKSSREHMNNWDNVYERNEFDRGSHGNGHDSSKTSPGRSQMSTNGLEYRETNGHGSSINHSSLRNKDLETIQHEPDIPECQPRKSRSASTMKTSSLSTISNKQSAPVGKERLENADDNCVICMDSFTNPKTLSCGHKFCTECIEESFKTCQPKCPSCGQLFGAQKGNQPPGRITIRTDAAVHLSGYERYPAIIIEYDIPDGVQGANHPNPGQRYHGTYRTAYLPDNPEGREVCKLLEKAFEADLIFTIGRSNTTGRDNVVIWNDVHHKTSEHGQYGYPDPQYLSRVTGELAAKGIVSESKNRGEKTIQTKSKVHTQF